MAASAASAGFAQQWNEQVRVWEKQLAGLAETLSDAVCKLPEAEDWGLLLEFRIPRRQKRADAVILARDLVILLEFKETASVSAERQVEDYGLDLRDFHAGTAGRVVIPMVVTPGPTACSVDNPNDPVKSVRQTSTEALANVLLDVSRIHSAPDAPQLDLSEWDSAAYKPTPTIIEAAVALYSGHTVTDITRSDSGIQNLKTTTEALVEAVESAKSTHCKVACFVTGVPGSGKTLAGLNLAHHATGDDGDVVFLSGNGPLVRVVQEALARDEAIRTKCRLGESRRRVSTFIQNVHSFVDEYLETEERIPHEHVVIFDEGQRAWNADKNRRKFGRDQSEPELLLELLDRRSDWAVAVILVGGGQEIHDGEAGLSEWGKALSDNFPHWHVWASPDALQGGDATAGAALFAGIPEPPNLRVEQAALHLAVSVRSFRAETVSEWVNAVVSGEPERASHLAARLGHYPLILTRELKSARAWLQAQTRGTRRCGLLASSGASRLRAEGIETDSSFHRAYPYERWFLDPREDIRSSYQLEVALTEFECQGLELDWVGVCWGGDYTWSQETGWIHRRFSGTKWQSVHKLTDREYLRNKYRVLLTRAREGLVVWVPKGDEQDPTRPVEWLETTAEYLLQCGMQPIG